MRQTRLVPTFVTLLALAGAGCVPLDNVSSAPPSTGTTLTNRPSTATNRPPTISSVNASPRSAAKDEGIILSVTAADPERAVLKYAWTTTSGVLSTTSGKTVTWKAARANGAVEPGVATVKVVVSDGRLTATATVSIEIDAEGNASVTGSSTTDTPATTPSAAPSTGPSAPASATPTPGASPGQTSEIIRAGAYSTASFLADGLSAAGSAALALDAAGGRLFFTSGAALRSTALGAADAAEVASGFSSPGGMVYDATRKVVYLADTGNHCIKRVALAGNTLGLEAGAVDVIAGQAGKAAYQDDAEGAKAAFSGPTGLVMLASNLYVADTGNHSIRAIDVADAKFPVSFVAGGKGTKGAPVTRAGKAQARFDAPRGIALTVKGSRYHLYVADSNNHVIREIDVHHLDQGDVTVYAGAAGAAGAQDGTVDQARFNRPQALAFDGKGNLYVGESGNHRIRRVEPAPVRVATLAGGATAGSGTGAPEEAAFGAVLALALDLGADQLPKTIWGFDAGAGKARLVKLSK